MGPVQIHHWRAVLQKSFFLIFTGTLLTLGYVPCVCMCQGLSRDQSRDSPIDFSHVIDQSRDSPIDLPGSSNNSQLIFSFLCRPMKLAEFPYIGRKLDFDYFTISMYLQAYREVIKVQFYNLTSVLRMPQNRAIWKRGWGK